MRFWLVFHCASAVIFLAEKSPRVIATPVLFGRSVPAAGVPPLGGLSSEPDRLKPGPQRRRCNGFQMKTPTWIGHAFRNCQRKKAESLRSAKCPSIREFLEAVEPRGGSRPPGAIAAGGRKGPRLKSEMPVSRAVRSFLNRHRARRSRSTFGHEPPTASSVRPRSKPVKVGQSQSK